MNSNHTFVICAYKESEYLEQCLLSVLNQRDKGQVILATSTPNDYIKSLCNKYNIKLFVNTGEKGIGGDWNFALSITDTKYVTLAHQDDLYYDDYASLMISKLEKNKNSIIGFSKYSEIRQNEIIHNSKLLKIKNFMNYPIKKFPKSKFIRNRVLSLGCSISCPSVTFNMENIKKFQFDTNFKCNLDWDAWSRLAKLDGSFVYIDKEIMGHRIHQESETTALLDNGVRFKEDLIIYNRYYPKFISNILHKFYRKSANSNTL